LSRPAELGGLKEGSYVLIEGEPCRIVEYTRSKPGKHGSAKARVVAVGVFDGVKRSIVSPVSAQVEVPVIEKRTGQVVSVGSGVLQLMDLETYDVFEISLPAEPQIRDGLTSGVEVEYWVVLNRKKIIRMKGS